MNAEKPIILILGPTAGGKTRLSIDLANALPEGGECICADSMQVYREMDIGTAKPTREEQALAPHHLFDLVDPDDDGFSVDTWLAAAERTIAEIQLRGPRGPRPIVVGGTNLYVQAFLEGLFDGPEPDPKLRRHLQAMPPEERRARLEQVDPESAARIHPNDHKRTIRAIEVHQLTGRRLSDLQNEWHQGRARTDTLIIGLDWPVEAINHRINARVKAMIDTGLVDEVRRLWQADRLGQQAREALGYKQIIDFLEGRSSLEDSVEQVKIRTRRFAKQQRTWLRRFRQFKPSTWLEAGKTSPAELTEKAIEAVLRPPSSDA